MNIYDLYLQRAWMLAQLYFLRCYKLDDANTALGNVTLAHISLMMPLPHLQNVTLAHISLMMPLLHLQNITHALAQQAFAHFRRLGPLWMLVCFLPSALTGGKAVLLATGFAYIADHSTTR